MTHAVDFENRIGGTQWNAHTTCGRYLRVSTVSQSPMRAVTCIECTVRLTHQRPEPGIL